MEAHVGAGGMLDRRTLAMDCGGHEPRRLRAAAVPSPTHWDYPAAMDRRTAVSILKTHAAEIRDRGGREDWP